MWDKIKQIKQWWKKHYIFNRDELSKLSDAEKGLIQGHRAQMASMERTQVELSTALSSIMNTDAFGDNTEYFYDFLGGGFVSGPVLPDDPDATPFQGDVKVGEKVVGRVIAVKPIDVLKELETFVADDMDKDLDAKIASLKTKKDLIRSNHYAKKEVISMVTRLENRKKWNEFKDFFGQFDNTTSGKIQDLVNKYQLVMNTSDLFIAKFPDEAINIMAEYERQTVLLCGLKPIFYVIAEKSMFQEEYKKKDPILLAQSPFGAYWQILGAWDKEMILLEEL